MSNDLSPIGPPTHTCAGSIPAAATLFIVHHRPAVARNSNQFQGLARLTFSCHFKGASLTVHPPWGRNPMSTFRRFVCRGQL